MRMQRQLPILTARAVVAPTHSPDNPTERISKRDAKIEPLAKAVWRKTVKADKNKSNSLDPSEVEHLGKGREVSVTITINVEEGKIRTKGSKTNNKRSDRKRKGSGSESDKEEDDDKRKKDAEAPIMKMDCHVLRVQTIIVNACADAGQNGKSEYDV